MTDNNLPPVPPIPPVPGAGVPAEPSAPEASDSGLSLDKTAGTPAPSGDTAPAGEYVQPAPPAPYGEVPPANPYAQQPYGQPQAQQPYGQQQPYAQPQQYGQQPYDPAQGYPGQPAPYAYGSYAAAPPRGLSIASMICGLGGFLLLSFGIGFLAGIAAVILGFLGKKNQPYAKGFWLTGIISGFVVIGLSVIGLVGIIAYSIWTANLYNSYY